MSNLTGNLNNTGHFGTTDLANNEVKIYIEIKENYFVATSKNKKAVQKVEKWYKDYFDLGKKEVLNDLLPIVKNDTDFILIDDNREAYKQYCEYYRKPPIKSTPLLIERFNKEFEIEKEKFIKTSIETTPETLIQKEIDFTQKEIDFINRKYFNIDPSKKFRPVAPRLGEIKKTSDELIHLKNYLKWLNERVEALSKENKETGNITIDNSLLENRTKLILLKELGVIDLLSKKIVNQTELAKFITEIFENNETKKQNTFDTIRTDLRYIDLKPKQNKKSPYTSTAMNKVNSLLTRYGLPVIKGF